MKEKCVMCGADTPYDTGTHIDLRSNYVEGAGQLCSLCANLVTSSDIKDDKESPCGVFVTAENIEKIKDNFLLGLYVRMKYLDLKF